MASAGWLSGHSTEVAASAQYRELIAEHGVARIILRFGGWGVGGGGWGRKKGEAEQL